MRVFLVAADFEENLGAGMIGAAAEAAGHDVEVLPFNERSELSALAARIAAAAPDVVGLSIQFQHRSHEFLTLARLVRAAGFEGHLTCGGQYPTLTYREVLSRDHGIDSVVLHEGEGTFVDLLDALGRGARPAEVSGIALLGDDGAVVRTEGRPLVSSLDELPFPKRYRPHARHMGVPFVPIMAARGCWGRCAYCSITSFYRDARSYGGGRTFRLRSPENVAAEMALLSHAAGGGAIFCFHDDNFLLPRKSDSLRRIRDIRAAFDEFGGGEVGIIGKCRPDTLDASLARELRELGVIRLYVGVENASDPGAAHLRRGQQQADIGRALDACRQAGIFSCYNLLIFEPRATLDDIRENIGFIRDHATHPVNFCRAEPYSGTPLMQELASREALSGSYLGWDYRLEDDRVELLFRVCAATFRERNFSCDGVANRCMGLGYSARLLEQFYEEREGRIAALSRRAEELTRRISLDTADFLEEALALVEGADPADRDAVEGRTALLGLRVAGQDRLWHAALDDLYREMAAYAQEAPPQWWARVPTEKLLRAVRNVALGASLAVYAGACDCGDSHTPSRDAGVDAIVVAAPAPIDAGVDAIVVADPAPIAAGVDAGGPFDPLPPDAGVVDPAPVDAGIGDGGPDADMIWEAAPADFGKEADGPAGEAVATRLLDQWRDTSPRRALRGDDLPLYDPPTVHLEAQRAGEAIEVELRGGPAAITTRWQCGGDVEGDERRVRWVPEDPADRLQVAVRSRGGIAVLSLRAGSVPKAG